MIADDDQTQDPTLHRLEQAIGAHGFTVAPEALERARARAASLFTLSGPRTRETMAATLGFARDIIAALVRQLEAAPPELRGLIERIEAVAGIPGATLGREVLGVPQLLQLRGEVAIEVELALLLAFGRARTVSLWTQWPGGDLRHLAHAGEFEREARQTRRLARRLVAGVPAGPRTSRELISVTVPRSGQPTASLIATVGDPQEPDQLLLEAAAPMLSAMLEREHLIGLYNGSEQALVTAAERRLARLRFDLHDGPQQDVILLATDLRSFRGRLESVLAGHAATERLVGNIDDLQARLVALDGDLRRISAYVRSPFMQPESLPDALAQLTDAFAGRTEIQPVTRLEGDLTGLSDSQQITVLGVIREALNNIREHSMAKNVTISVITGSRGIEATVTDDGCGFDPETSLVQAARDGHLGLVGMHERVRLLGGLTRIDSRPGGPTVISVSLPRWTGGDLGAPRIPG